MLSVCSNVYHLYILKFVRLNILVKGVNENVGSNTSDGDKSSFYRAITLEQLTS